MDALYEKFTSPVESQMPDRLGRIWQPFASSSTTVWLLIGIQRRPGCDVFPAMRLIQNSVMNHSRSLFHIHFQFVFPHKISNAHQQVEIEYFIS
jgi:hypothetical protein